MQNAPLLSCIDRFPKPIPPLSLPVFCLARGSAAGSNSSAHKEQGAEWPMVGGQRTAYPRADTFLRPRCRCDSFDIGRQTACSFYRPRKPFSHPIDVARFHTGNTTAAQTVREPERPQGIPCRCQIAYWMLHVLELSSLGIADTKLQNHHHSLLFRVYSIGTQ